MLGISDFVAMSSVSPNLDQTMNLTSKGVFGGSIQFLVTKSLGTLGPTWTLIHFKGPGGLASLSQVNTDKITLAFAEGPNSLWQTSRERRQAPTQSCSECISSAADHRFDQLPADEHSE